MKDPVVIIGSGGHGRELLDIIEAINAVHQRFEFLGFLDDTGGMPEILARRRGDVIGPIEALRSLDAHFLIGIGSPGDRRRIDERVRDWGREAVTIVHPAATVGSDVEFAPGCVVAAGARVTTNVRMGRHVHLNVNCSASHDCRFGDYVTLNPGAHVNGWVRLGDEVVVGSGAVVRDKISIGARSFLGAGCVVVADLPEDKTVVGVPAKDIPSG